MLGVKAEVTIRKVNPQSMAEQKGSWIKRGW
jgi:hypothetical protein